MKFIYFGSFHVSADILKGMIEGGLIPALVVCSPDRPAGRKKILTPPAVKKLITEKGWQIPLLQPEKPTDILEELKKIKPDLAIVMGYPHIIPRSIIDLPRLGTIGVHPSLLPRYRGASPMQTAILNGETESGVTLYVIDEKVDHGPIIAQETTSIKDLNNSEVEKVLTDSASSLLVDVIPKFVNGDITPREQNHCQATMTQKFTTEDAQIDMESSDKVSLYNKIRALNPEPGTWTMNLPGYEGKRVKLLSAILEDNGLRITEIQPDGKKPMRV